MEEKKNNHTYETKYIPFHLLQALKFNKKYPVYVYIYTVESIHCSLNMHQHQLGIVPSSSMEESPSGQNVSIYWHRQYRLCIEMETPYSLSYLSHSSSLTLMWHNLYMYIHGKTKRKKRDKM